MADGKTEARTGAEDAVASDSAAAATSGPVAPETDVTPQVAAASSAEPASAASASAPAAPVASDAPVALAAPAYGADPSWLVETTRRLVAVDSTVGYYAQIEPVLAQMVGELGFGLTRDYKHTCYVRVPGRDRTRSVCLGAHLDTIGFIVRGFNDDGTLRVRRLGGINWASAEGECVRIHCRDGRTVTGQLICDHHSVHVWKDAKDLPRDEDHMSVSVVGDVSSADEARALGITQGAIVSVDPHFEAFGNGYVVSRHIDDKACVAALLGCLRWIRDTGFVPACDVLMAFPIFEEIGHGGAFVPDGVTEYVALDITLIGPDYDADEHSVGVIASDYYSVYDWDLTNRLIACAERTFAPGEWNTQVCFNYGTDASAAYTKGANVAAGAFGPACLSSHGRERCHADAIARTQRLACAYVESLG